MNILEIIICESHFSFQRPSHYQGRSFLDLFHFPGIIPVSYMKRHLGDKNLRMRHHYLGGSGTKPVALALRVKHVLIYEP